MCWCRRNASRRARLIRLRSCERLWIFVVTVMPNRGRGSGAFRLSERFCMRRSANPFGWLSRAERTNPIRCGPWIRRPVFWTRRKSPLFRMRASFGNEQSIIQDRLDSVCSVIRFDHLFVMALTVYRWHNSFTAAGSPSINNLTASLCGHPGAKPVGCRSTFRMWLIGTLHSDFLTDVKRGNAAPRRALKLALGP